MHTPKVPDNKESKTRTSPQTNREPTNGTHVKYLTQNSLKDAI